MPGYVFDRGRADQGRLIRSSEGLGAFVTEACARAGLGPGGRAIDVGCGPLGALTILAEVVGARGQVVGLDASGEALELARSILDQRGCTNVTLVHAALDAVTNAQLFPPGPFDLAYARRFLVHQGAPADTLRRMASFVRSGGRIVAHEIPPGTGYPSLTPTVPALRRVDDLVHAAVTARGGRADAAQQLPAHCRDAGMRLLSMRGLLPPAEPVDLLETFQGVLRSLRSVIIEKHVSSDSEVAGLLAELETAKSVQYVSAFANLYIEMIAEVP
jgi:SAM-dependent methyltransferase